jgi:arylsulfatase A-like enzyme
VFKNPKVCMVLVLLVGLPGVKEGLSDKDPTMVELLRPLDYACGEFGKNHLGDRNEFQPTVHGFQDFFGNLYHLNAEEEPENPEYPKNPQFKARFCARRSPRPQRASRSPQRAQDRHADAACAGRCGLSIERFDGNLLRCPGTHRRRNCSPRWPVSRMAPRK